MGLQAKSINRSHEYRYVVCVCSPHISLYYTCQQTMNSSQTMKSLQWKFIAMKSDHSSQWKWDYNSGHFFVFLRNFDLNIQLFLSDFNHLTWIIQIAIWKRWQLKFFQKTLWRRPRPRGRSSWDRRNSKHCYHICWKFVTKNW